MPTIVCLICVSGFCFFSIGNIFGRVGSVPNAGLLHRHISMKGRYKATVHIHCSFRTPQLPETVVTTVKYLIQSTSLPELPGTLFLTMMQLTVLPSVCQSCLFNPAVHWELQRSVINFTSMLAKILCPCYNPFEHSQVQGTNVTCAKLGSKAVYSQHILLFVDVGTNALYRVNSEVTAVTDWHSLGIALKLSPSTLEQFGANYKDPARCMTEVLVTWLRQHQTPHSWKSLVSALMSPTVNRTDVAQKIAAVHCEPLVYLSCSMKM